MAQLNITLNQDEILQLLSADREGAFRTLLQESLNSVLKAESQEQLQAAPRLSRVQPGALSVSDMVQWKSCIPRSLQADISV